MVWGPGDEVRSRRGSLQVHIINSSWAGAYFVAFNQKTNSRFFSFWRGLVTAISQGVPGLNPQTRAVLSPASFSEACSFSDWVSFFPPGTGLPGYPDCRQPRCNYPVSGHVSQSKKSPLIIMYASIDSVPLENSEKYNYYLFTHFLARVLR